MIADPRLVLCALASIAGHLGLVAAMQLLPRKEHAALPAAVQVRVVQPSPPAPEPEPPPQPPPPPPQPAVYERARAPTGAVKKQAPAAPPNPGSEQPPPTPDPNPTPVFGVTMQSTSQASAGPAMPVGNSTRVNPDRVGPAPKALGQVVAAVDVTKMPLPRGRCSGKYTEQARNAAVEGVVVLDLIVDEHGRARDIQVVEGLPHGLTQAAVAALERCTFSPGEKDGTPVAVRVRGFKIRFFMQEAR